MQIRKNTKEHSAIFEVLKKHEGDKKRNSLIKIFTLKAGDSLDKKKPVEESKELSDLYYNLNYNSILNNLLDKEHQLNKSEEQEDLFYFESNYTPVETPFQLTSPVLEEVNKLLKDKKFKARAPKVLEEMTKDVDDNVDTQEDDGKVVELFSKKPAENKKEKKVEKKVQDAKPPLNVQLKFDMEFTDLDKNLFKSLSVSKADVLNYYDEISEVMFPFIQNHLLFHDDIDTLLKNNSDQPEWLKTANVYFENVEGEFVVAQNKKHLLFLVEHETVEISPWASKNKNLKNPSILTISLQSNGSGFEKVLQVARILTDIVDRCELKGMIKTTGSEDLDLHIFLDGKSDYKYSASLADILMRLVSKKEPAVASLKRDDKDKVFLNASSNALGETFIAPYSINKSSFLVATPLDSEEVNGSIDHRSFTMDAVLKKIKSGKALETPEYYNAREAYEMLDRRYGFLI